MDRAQEKFELLMQEIETFLAPEGFRRARNSFSKRLSGGKIRWNIEPQKSQSNTTERVKFTFWVHAEWKQRPAWYENWEPKRTWYGGAGGRIGYLMPQREDTWWEITDKTSIEFLGDQINGILSSCVLPFLRQFQTEQEIKDHLRSCTKGSMRKNYPHALQMLAFDLLENKSQPEIEERIENVRHLGKINLVDKAVVEADIQRVLKTHK